MTITKPPTGQVEDTGDAPETPSGQLGFERIAGVRPESSTFTVSGALDSEEMELVMYSSVGEVKAVAVAEVKDADGNPYPGRIHKIKLGG